MDKKITPHNILVKTQKTTRVLAMVLFVLFLFPQLNIVNDEQGILGGTIDRYGGEQEGKPLVSQSLAWEANGSAICTADYEQNDTQIIGDGAGGAIIAWVDRRSLVPNIYAQRINAAGSVLWTTGGVLISTSTAFQDDPQLVSDGTGGAIITWEDNRSTTFHINIWAQRIDSAGNTLWTANRMLICTADENQLHPEIVSDGAGGVIITWEDYRTGYGQTDIYAQRVNSTGDHQWAPNGIPICNASEEQLEPQIISDSVGGAIIAWTDGREGSGDNNIYAQRVNPAGDNLWLPNGTAICAAANDQSKTHLASDGDHGAIIVWYDDRTGGPSGSDDLYAQHIGSAGDAWWDGNGVPICTKSVYYESEIISDGFGGAIIAWQDNRVSGWYVCDIYAQRVNAFGNALWRVNGTPVSTELSGQVGLQFVSDGSGGAIFTWTGFRNGIYADIYSRRLSSAGEIQWGFPICTAVNHQSDSKIVSNGAGGMIIVWCDLRYGNEDIFAQWINSPQNDVTPTPNNLLTLHLIALGVIAAICVVVGWIVLRRKIARMEQSLAASKNSMREPSDLKSKKPPAVEQSKK